MDAMIVAARAVHFAAAMLLFGELVFALTVAVPATRAGGIDALARVPRLGAWTLAAGILSGFAWLVAASALMSGLPLAQAIDGHNLSVVVAGTAFGRLWVWRFGLAVVLALLLTGLARSTGEVARSRVAVVAAVVAAVYLATLAWSGHAASAEVSGRYPHLVSDVVHLLAAGAWVGALPGLVVVLRRIESPALGIVVARRFSTLGVVSVGALAASGMGNTWYLVGDVPALVGTEYGRLLLVKLALFGAMVVLAAINRSSLRASLDGPSQTAVLRALRRNASIECAAGAVVVAIVAALGDMLPGAHQSPSWPFDRTLDWQVAQQSVGAGTAAIVTGIVALAAAGFAVVAWSRSRWRPGIAGSTASLVASAGFAWVLAVPAYPTTYAFAPTPYTTGAVVHGAALYESNCRACHGARGRGDGPAAASPGIVPTDLAAHASGHHVGELFWWIGHGIPGTPMPAFSPRLGESEIWDLVHFLRAQSDAATATTGLSEHAQPWMSAIVAPDFTFERGERGQESLRQPVAEPITLVVLYSLPQSLPYLRALAAQAPALREVGLRVVSLPLESRSPRDEGLLPDSAMAQPDVATAYAMFAPRNGDATAAPTEVDYLIDRQGYVRARWIGIPDSAPDRAAAVFDQAQLLFRERQRAPSAAGHLH